jgi:hypothetical protein
MVVESWSARARTETLAKLRVKEDGTNASSINVGDGIVTKLDYAVIKMVINADSKVDWLINISASSLGSWRVAWIYAIGVVH